MRKFYFSLFILFPFLGQSQVAFSVLDQNNAAVSIADGGNFFLSADTLSAYRVPKDSMQGLLFSATNWFGGVDVNGQLKLSATDLDGAGTDLWPGPLTMNTATAGTNPLNQTIWTVSKDQINFHLSNFQNAGYVPVSEIASWPAHGDVATGFDFFLAPFVDINQDGVYNPLDGDYPCIKGDRATFMIMNDKKNVHSSGGDPIGLELQYMFYQYDTPELANTTFIDLRIINRGVQTLNDFHTSFVMDGDLGNNIDDYFGCDTNRNVQYYYNDSIDENAFGVMGYGVAPPSFGVVCLSDDIHTATSLYSTFGTPISAAGKYQVMKGLHSDGSPRLNNLLQPTSFTYYDVPSDNLGWSNVNNSSTADQKTVMSINLGTFAGLTEKEISYAIVYSRDGNSNIDNVDSLLLKVDQVQSFYDNSTDGNCNQSILALDKKQNSNLEITIFPNPSEGEFFIHVDDLNQFDLTIQDMTGRTLTNKKNISSKTKISFDAPAGIYTAIISTERGTFSKRISIR